MTLVSRLYGQPCAEAPGHHLRSEGLSVTGMSGHGISHLVVEPGPRPVPGGGCMHQHPECDLECLSGLRVWRWLLAPGCSWLMPEEQPHELYKARRPGTLSRGHTRSNGCARP